MTGKFSEILRDRYLLEFESYEEYLDSFITARDLYYLRSKSISRRIIELGYHTLGTLDRETFYDRVNTTKRYMYLLKNPFALCYESTEPEDILLQELSIREKANRYGELYTIIFMRDSAKSQSQVSAYIDYSHRLKSEDWLPYFNNKKKLKPKKDDLSYFDWKSGTSILNESLNFKPLIDRKNGLVFQNIHDSTYITVNPNVIPAIDPQRKIIYSDFYKHVILYDHHVLIQESQ